MFSNAQVDEKLTPVYGGIHVHANSTAQAIANGASYVKVQNFADNDPANEATPDAANDQITVLKAGTYRVDGSFSFSSGTSNVVAFGSLFVNEVEAGSIHFTRKISTAGDVGNAGFCGIITLAANDVLSFRTRHDYGSSVDLTFTYMNLNLVRIDIE